MSHRVVDDLELIHVHEEHHTRNIFTGPENVVGKDFVKGIPVQEACQEIMAGEVIEAVFALFLFGCVATGENHSALAVRRGKGLAGGFKPAVQAVAVLLTKSKTCGTTS